MKYKILAVDDNIINLKLLTRALVDPAYEILTAQSGTEALEVALRDKPDLILLDVMMDDMDGFAVCDELQKNEHTKYTPIIFLSAKNDSKDKARGLALGAVDYLTKPFDPIEISARVHTHLSVRKNIFKLQSENRTLKKQMNTFDSQIAEYLNKIHTDFEIDNGFYSGAAKVKSKQPPQTTGLIPLRSDDEHFVFLMINGFKKNYATLAVELLLEQFASGYLRPIELTTNNQEYEQQLMHALMERFSPDVYHVPFSFALCWLYPEQRSLHFYGIQQEAPCLLTQEYKCLPSEPQLLPFSGENAALVTAQKINLPLNTAFCFYRKGIHDISSELYQALFSSFSSDSEFSCNTAVNELFAALPDAEEDQLVSLFYLK